MGKQIKPQFVIWEWGSERIAACD